MISTRIVIKLQRAILTEYENARLNSMLKLKSLFTYPLLVYKKKTNEDQKANVA